MGVIPIREKEVSDWTSLIIWSFWPASLPGTGSPRCLVAAVLLSNCCSEFFASSMPGTRELDFLWVIEISINNIMVENADDWEIQLNESLNCPVYGKILHCSRESVC